MIKPENEALIKKLKGIKFSCLDFEGDPPHNGVHNIRVFAIAERLARLKGLPLKEGEEIGDMCRLHDSGYAFYSLGMLNLNEHVLGSYVVALKSRGKRVADGVLHHADDVLPRRMKRVTRMVRDADRLERVGFAGLLSLMYYLGFRSEDIVHLNPRKHPIESVFDTWFPHDSLYEDTCRIICETKLYPFLKRTNRVGQAIAYCEQIFDRYNGVLDDKLQWKIEPVSPEGRRLFKNRFEGLIDFYLRL